MNLGVVPPDNISSIKNKKNAGLLMYQTICIYCYGEISTDTWGWGYFDIEHPFHMECLEMTGVEVGAI